jgi:hypothetical protein
MLKGLCRIDMITSLSCRVINNWRLYVLYLWLLIAVLASAPKLDAGITLWPSNPGSTAGAPTPREKLAQSFASVNPNDNTVDINQSASGGDPQIRFNNDTGRFSGVNGLQLPVTSSKAFTMTVSVAAPVFNLPLQIWHSDAATGQFIDHLADIQALAQGGGGVSPNSVTSAVASYNTITGTGLSSVALGTVNANGANQSTIDIVLNGKITQFPLNPSLDDQGTAVGSLTYTPAPEFESVWGAVAACAVAIGHELFRRRQARRRR